MKCHHCKKRKAIRSSKFCFQCKDDIYKSYVGELKKLKTVENPCFFCKKDLGSIDVITVKVRQNSYKKMHRSCNTRRLQAIKTRQWKVNHPLSGGTGSKK